MKQRRAKILVMFLGRIGGGARMTFDLAQATRESKLVEASFLLSDRFSLKREIESLGVHVEWWNGFGSILHVAAKSVTIISLQRRIVKICAEREITTVVDIMPHVFSPIVMRSLRRHNIRTVCIGHEMRPLRGSFAWWLFYWIKQEYECVDRIVVLSKEAEGEAGRRFVKSKVVRWFHPPPIVECTSRPVSFIDKHHVHLLFWGSIYEYKGIDILCDMWQLLYARHRGWRLTIVGRGDVRLRPKISALSGAQVVWSYIPEEDVCPMLMSADVLLCPYKESSQSGIVAWANATGTPIVGTPVGGLREQIEESGIGVVSSAMEAGSFAAAVETLVREWESYAGKTRGGLGEGGAKAAWERWVSCLVALHWEMDRSGT